jgi:hypothetical protein
VSLGPEPSRRAVVILCAAVLLAQVAAIPFSYLPYVLMLGGIALLPELLPIWLLPGALAVGFHWLAALLATLAVRRLRADARSLSGLHVSRCAMPGLLAATGVGFGLLLCDSWIGYPPRVGFENPSETRETLVGGLALSILVAGLILGTVRGARYRASSR